MTDHKSLPVHGYQPQSDQTVNIVNGFKIMEERTLRILDDMANQKDIFDPRSLAVGRTHLEQAYMAINRSVFKPKRVGLPEDTDKVA